MQVRAFERYIPLMIIERYIIYTIDVPRPLTNDLWVFLFQTIDAESFK